LTIANSIVFGQVGNDIVNAVVAGPTYPNPTNNSTLEFIGANIVGALNNQATLNPASTVPITSDPQLSPLATDNAPDAPQTLAISDTSPAYNAAVGSCPATDERGVARPQFGNCDLGAYELRPFDDRIFADEFE